MKTITPTELFFTEMDFNPAFDGQLSSVKAAQAANTKIQPLVDENARLNKTMQLQIEELVAGANTRTEFRTQINDLKNCIHVTNEVVAKQAAENTKLRAALELAGKELSRFERMERATPLTSRHTSILCVLNKIDAALSGKGDV